ncbi:MAG TPA: sigma-70 family RNA polymerase sigma factor [Solirubrobacteraceae bacterium]|jgi:DNA-directed RNA polymerase specialized sigma24 family protein
MTSEDHDSANGLSIADVARVYREMAEPLEQVVRRLVCEAEPVVEDACQSAWCRLVGHRARVREETVFGWLAQTAIHEAFKLSRRRVRDLSLDFELEQGADPVALGPEPWELLAERERITGVRTLAIRSQRFVWLHALGLSYTEMAAYERCSTRTVDRQLGRARGQLRAAA